MTPPLAAALVQVTAPHFCAGIEFDNRHIVVKAAPILKWTVGKSAAYLASYFQRKGWHAITVCLAG